MNCNCSLPKCSCPTIAVAPAVICEPGPPTNLTADLTVIPAGSESSVQISGVPPNQHLQFLLAAGSSPVFNPVVPVTDLPAGSTPSASINNTNPLAPQLSLELVAGADGTDGLPAWSSMTGSFTMPAVGATAIVNVPNTAFMTLGSWVAMQGAGTAPPYCGWLVVAGILNGTQAFLRNPGASDGAPTGGIATNVAATTVIVGSGDSNQIIQSGRIGPAGPAGGDADPLVVSLVTTIPVSPPATPADNLVLYQDVAPPSTPTVMRFYSWDGASWVGSSNMVGAAGSQTFFGSADPNVTPPSPSSIGDTYWRTQGSTLTYYQRTGVSTWTVRGTFALEGTAATFTTVGSPGTVTLDAATFYHVLDVDKNIDLDLDTANYAGAGNWTVLVYNSDPSSIDIAQGSLLANPAITFPVAVATTETAVVKISRTTTDGATLNAFSIDDIYIQG